MAPPLGFTVCMSGSSSCSHASTTDANASLISTTSTSRIVRPLSESSRFVAAIGPVSINTGSLPTRHDPTIVASGCETQCGRTLAGHEQDRAGTVGDL